MVRPQPALHTDIKRRGVVPGERTYERPVVRSDLKVFRLVELRRRIRRRGKTGRPAGESEGFVHTAEAVGERQAVRLGVTRQQSKAAAASLIQGL